MKLTENFSQSEFNCKSGAPMPDNVLANVKILAAQLQALRNELKAGIKINSGYRSPAHNAKIGGAKKSQHLTGRAADIVVNGYTPKQVAEVIERLISEGKMIEGGLKAYRSFTHYDHRGVKSRW
jgi:uncharacterized protein YcbK (DUF882 family)